MAQEVVFQEVTTGAENDLEHATTLARQMVCLFGMSDPVGLARCAQRHDGMYLPGAEGVFPQVYVSMEDAHTVPLVLSP